MVTVFLSIPGQKLCTAELETNLCGTLARGSDILGRASYLSPEWALLLSATPRAVDHHIQKY